VNGNAAEHEAATKIQAGFKGESVRQGKKPLGVFFPSFSFIYKYKSLYYLLFSTRLELSLLPNIS